MSDIHYVRTEMLPEREPPASTTGAVGWMRKNLFDGWLNSILTIVSGVFILYVIAMIVPWAWSPTWNAESLDQCREIVDEAGKHEGACWGVVRDRWPQLLYGFYPQELRLRPTLAFFLLFVAIIPVLFSMISRRMNWFLLALVLLGATFFVASGPLMIAVQLVLAATLLYLGYTLIATNRDDRAEEIAAGARRLPNPLIFSGIFVFLMPWLLWGGSVWT
ncbi:MAG TPA: amino acid ABC transporter permease, partial [Rhodobacterales bacterium]|nr:amino acid ABC transporter permease [Rhodobacterales bacterium]